MREVAKDVAKDLKVIKEVNDAFYDEQMAKALRRLYPIKIDGKKLKALGLLLTFAPEGVTTLPGLAVLASSKLVDKLFSPLSLHDLRREFKGCFKELEGGF